MRAFFYTIQFFLRGKIVRKYSLMTINQADMFHFLRTVKRFNDNKEYKKIIA